MEAEARSVSLAQQKPTFNHHGLTAARLLLIVRHGYASWNRIIEDRIVGAGYTGTVLLKNGKLSDVLGELQVRRLSMEVQQLASSRQITVLNGSSGQSNLTSLVVPAAALGSLGLWIHVVEDLMYVTKRNMANAVSNLTKHLDHVSEALAATKRHLTQRIENLDGKLDEQVEISKLIRNEVNDVRGDLSQIGFDLDELQRMVSGLPILNTSLKAAPILKYLNQDIHGWQATHLRGQTGACKRWVMYLCSIVNGRKVKMPEMLQDQLKIAGNSLPKSNDPLLFLPSNLACFNSLFSLGFEGRGEIMKQKTAYLPTCELVKKNVILKFCVRVNFKGLKEIADSGSSGNKLLTDGNTQDGSNKMNKTLMSSSVYSQTDVFSMRVVYFSV
ncbi:hypothetical protein Sango_3069800 [Sesamum angolense]|uniref:DUF1664 domain-containing protein n=1 Tax=Sesamum angolense TaxID=2727404 RepID=A0AAE1TA94_9LAMI|nr:hypothetical protein Sango_3069800 [Sesamum angolense]